MSIEEKVENYKKTLELFPNDQEKYQYLIEQAKESTEFPKELRQDSFKVHGCQSQVWLVPEQNETAEEIASSEIDLMEEFDLGVILSPARRNGAYSMLKTIKEYAKNLIN